MKQGQAIDYSSRNKSFENWFQTPLGRHLLANQRAHLERSLAHLTGARQLQVGVSHRLPLTNSTDFTQKIISTPEHCAGIPDGVVVCDADELPFPGDSMDLVLLHHTADFSPYPHQVLREAARVLRGEGTIVLIGFNPLSTWGVRKAVSQRKAGPWGARFLWRRRMEDWLYLLNFKIEASGTHFFRLPVQRVGGRSSGGLCEKLSGYGVLPVGAYYCILAKKRVCARIPQRTVWRRNKVIGLVHTREYECPER
ncbi:class I SAM-dependent methyltransferase [Marinobacter piscensis]|uniref:class I SAM-dependent methyltransferase n=1 Tax=Marinobacter piscensis TaxID=1562308 RepID=UPI0011AA9317|nr:class I SAM-dependent methyltransferase [Marinobacter piscensis]